MRAVRLGAGYGAIAFMLPYLALKIAWLCGNPVGLSDKSLVGSPGIIAANAISFAMDLVAVGIALTFTHGWGLGAPAWLVLFPMWVATGFLVPAVVIAPIATIWRMLAFNPAPHSDSILQPWAGLLVGASFSGQGAGLILAFVLYVRTRWAHMLGAAAHGVVSGPTHQVQVVLASASAVPAVAAGGLHLAWAFGGTVGLGHDALSGRTTELSLLNGIWGLLSIAAAAGISMMVHRWGRAPFWLSLVLTWAGAGSLFAWGLWSLIFVLTGITFGPRAEVATALQNCLSFVKFTTGMLIGVVAVVLLAERDAALLGTWR